MKNPDNNLPKNIEEPITDFDSLQKVLLAKRGEARPQSLNQLTWEIEHNIELPGDMRARLLARLENFSRYIEHLEPAERAGFTEIIMNIGQEDVLGMAMQFNSGLNADLKKGDPRIIEMFNKGYAKVKLMEMFEKILDGGKGWTAELKKVYRFSFDVNGLKAVNDLNGGKHEMGDEYLRRVARAIKESPTMRAMRSGGASHFAEATRDGGDEFGIIVYFKEEQTEKEINDYLEAVIEEVRMIGVADLLDFNKDEVVFAFLGISKEDIKNINELEPEERKIKMDGLRAQMEKPESFYFPASIQGGAVNFFASSQKIITEKDLRGLEYQKMLQTFMGGLFDMSDRHMKENKDEFKRSLVGQRRENETKEKFESRQFLARIYSRTEEEARLKRIITEATQRCQNGENPCEVLLAG